jgi:hypothetical protein
MYALSSNPSTTHTHKGTMYVHFIDYSVIKKEETADIHTWIIPQGFTLSGKKISKVTYHMILFT